MSERVRQSTFTTARDEIQLVLGELGEALPYVQQSALDHGLPSVGWYANLRRQDPACSCQRCQATRARRPAFLAGRRLEAIQEVGAYKATHEPGRLEAA